MVEWIEIRLDDLVTVGVRLEILGPDECFRVHEYQSSVLLRTVCRADVLELLVRQDVGENGLQDFFLLIGQRRRWKGWRPFVLGQFRIPNRFCGWYLSALFASILRFLLDPDDGAGDEQPDLV